MGKILGWKGLGIQVSGHLEIASSGLDKWMKSDDQMGLPAKMVSWLPSWIFEEKKNSFVYINVFLATILNFQGENEYSFTYKVLCIL